MANEIAELRRLVVQGFERVDERFASVDEQLGEMRADQARLEELSARAFARIEERFDGVEGRLARSEVIQEEMRSDSRAFGESLRGLDRRVDALEERNKVG